MPPITRAEGYARGRTREQAGLAWAERFLRDVAGVPVRRIADAAQNYAAGDLTAASGRTVEVKRQPIDPDRYRENFVEVFEATGNPAHAGGLRAVAELLGLDVATLVDAPARTDTGRERVGPLPLVSVSLRSVAGSAITLYVNPGQWIYAYDSPQLIAHVRDAVVTRGFRVGAGRSNGSTYAVQVPLPPCVWAWRHNQWTYAGRGSAVLAAQGLADRLGYPLAPAR